MRPALLLVLAALLAAAEMPPSPSSVPGIRIIPPPAFTHWPPVAYDDEPRHAAFRIAYANPTAEPDTPFPPDPPLAGASGTVGWAGQPAAPITLPKEGSAIGGLLTLVPETGERVAEVSIAGKAGPLQWRLPLRVVDARGEWPLAGLRDGFPVDAAGVPVVLLDHRRKPESERTWKLLQDRPSARPSGKPLLVGDPLESLGASPWTGIDAEARPATDVRRPHHAVLVALARLPVPLPRTILWCPGNGALAYGTWDQEETRLLGALATRLGALGFAPSLVLALPPEPAEERLRPLAAQRREALIAAADMFGWKLIDLARAAGPADRANRIGDAVFTAYPTGEALDRIRAVLAEALAR